MHGSRTHLRTHRCALTTVLKTAPLTGEAALPGKSPKFPWDRPILWADVLVAETRVTGSAEQLQGAVRVAP